MPNEAFWLLGKKSIDTLLLRKFTVPSSFILPLNTGVCEVKLIEVKFSIFGTLPLSAKIKFMFDKSFTVKFSPRDTFISIVPVRE